MASNRASADDFEEHVESTALPGQQSTKHFPPSERPNAFTEMMSPRKPKSPKSTLSTTDAPTKHTVFAGRDGLAAYTTDPASFPASREEEKKVRAIAASELRRRFGKFSATERPRLAALESDDPPDELPSGRDWEREIMSGTHANPSMNHLHIHVLSKDMVGESMKKRNHYLSFTTRFLIGMDQYPLDTNDERRRYGHFPEDMLCWRCGRNFGNKMARLREHLEDEFEEWKKE
ncbi:aprataxin-like protein [Rachicladosporium monterosium]|uniref:Aprataxin-like protein n=1 Tax=Rachicladosporium monterosium TaxID=1507873 RepID=A0ABR0LDX3_9PEZI|nr:aprataxin-like protein [Rachicladosporium monterosium]